jgi:hypothetical protein
MGGRQSRFFVQFSKRRGLRLFPRLDLAAGELPGARHVLRIAPAGDQNSAVAEGDRERDVEALFGVGNQAGAPLPPGL